jgi:hypothetical protein
MNTAQHAALVKAGYYEERNGASHAALTGLAFDILIEDLTARGNIPGAVQREALYELVGFMTRYAQGTATGRRAFNLATGCGKTSAIIAWIAAAHRLGLDHIAVAVAASKIDALCSLKQALLDHGVPEEKIGLKHSHGRAAALPSTGNDDRLYQLITHSRVRGGTDQELFTLHQGQKRAAMIYDETLFKADTIAVSDKAIRKSLAAFKEEVRGKSTDCTGLIQYLDACVGLITRALEEVRLAGQPLGRSIVLPELATVELAGYEALLGHSAEWEPLRDLLRLSPHELRVMTTQQDNGVVWYQLSVPAELENVLILDASYPIRKLVQLDKTIICDSKYADKEVKRFDQVTIHQMLAFGGRHSISESFRHQHKEKRDVSREVVEIVKTTPTEKGILIFTFKARPSDRVDITAILRRDLLEAGIDLDARLPDGKPRFCFLTWGDETSRNDCSHCGVIVMAGILRRSYLDLASAIVGQSDDLRCSVDNNYIREILDSEIIHSVYQGLSRGVCRTVDNGQSMPMELYLIHPDLNIRKGLGHVMPGVKWAIWEPTYKKAEASGVIARLALKLHDHLKQIPPDQHKVATRRIKEALDLGTTPSRTFTEAVRLVGNAFTGWELDGRSLVRVTPFG